MDIRVIANQQLTIILRTCEGVPCVHPHNPRPYDMSKTDVIKACFASLWRAACNSQLMWRIYVIDDGSSPELRDWMRGHKGGRVKGTQLIVEEHSGLGNAGSLARQFALVEELNLDDDSWVYLVEDDYLHTGDCFWRVRDFLNFAEGDFYISPYCQPYNAWHAVESRQAGLQVVRPSCLIMSEVMRTEKPRRWVRTPLHDWMQVFHTCWTFLTTAGVLRRHWGVYQAALPRWDDATISAIYETVPCWTPIPALASHFQEGCQSPGFNQQVVREWVEELKT